MAKQPNGIVNSLTSARLPKWMPWVLLGSSWAVTAVLFAILAADSGGSYNIVAVVFFGTVLFDVLLVTISYLVEGSRKARDRLVTSLVSFALLVLGAALWFAATGTPFLSPDAAGGAAGAAAGAAADSVV